MTSESKDGEERQGRGKEKVMKRFFIIDLENVGKRALDAKDRDDLAKMSSEDVFVICQNKMPGSAPKELLNALEGTKASYRIVEIANCGKKCA